jgi:hypothetical protein
MRWLVAAAFITTSVHAFADEAPPGAQSYRMETLAVDGITAGLFVGGIETRGAASDRLLKVALVGLAVGAPTIHLLHHRWASAGSSLILRVGLPVVGAWLGEKFGPSPDQCGDCDAQWVHAYQGFAVGTIAAMALDTWLLAGEDDSRTPAIVPSVRATNGGVSLGLGGRF